MAGNLSQYGKKLSNILVDPQELNSYSYVTNNPLRYFDPFGLSGEMTIYPEATGIDFSKEIIDGHSWIT